MSACPAGFLRGCACNGYPATTVRSATGRQGRVDHPCGNNVRSASVPIGGRASPRAVHGGPRFRGDRGPSISLAARTRTPTGPGIDVGSGPDQEKAPRLCNARGRAPSPAIPLARNSGGRSTTATERWAECSIQGCSSVWGEVYPGRPVEQVSRLFSEVVVHHDRLLEEGRISGFAPCCARDSGRRSGWSSRLHDRPRHPGADHHPAEFLAYVHRAEMLIKDVGVDQRVLDEALRHMMETLGPQVRALA